MPPSVKRAGGAAAPTLDWGAGLPDELLTLVSRRALQHVTIAPASPVEAARILQALSPCRRWRAAALAVLAETPLRLHLDTPAAAACPLLSYAACAELVLPATPDRFKQKAPAAYTEADGHKWGSSDAAAKAHSAALRLLSSPAFRAASGLTLAALHNLPARVATSAQLLAGFPRLRHVGVHLGFWLAELGTCPDVWAACFPASVQSIAARSDPFMDHLRWLPPRRLQAVEIKAGQVSIRSSEGWPHGCDALRATAVCGLLLHVDVLAALAGCATVRLRASEVVIETRQEDGPALPRAALPDSEPAAAARPLGAGGSPPASCGSADVAALLRAWASALRPLFNPQSERPGAGSRFGRFEAVAESMHLEVVDGLDPEHLTVIPLARLPPRAWRQAVPAAEGAAPTEARVDEGGLAAMLTFPAPGEPSRTLLTVTRTPHERHAGGR